MTDFFLIVHQAPMGKSSAGLRESLGLIHFFVVQDTRQQDCGMKLWDSKIQVDNNLQDKERVKESSSERPLRLRFHCRNFPQERGTFLPPKYFSYPTDVPAEVGSTLRNYRNLWYGGCIAELQEPFSSLTKVLGTKSSTYFWSIGGFCFSLIFHDNIYDLKPSVSKLGLETHNQSVEFVLPYQSIHFLKLVAVVVLN